ncbi:MAG: hypothetical protein A2622_00045 [Bdellovibrionales bacterium RIFCSPHIGHO2_01_FULL_40_29]|nr:MAG: hypothetical protein A2622_00045 [Bdellovibrionales bacterium RIFCSPHIGHO2_01_FULL_40_29]OFZ32518.1 MAG: hypothetical protein A3D17_04645 [Bdellovibrionales bacterium RIFCSPHIGHO2_02_FULL_40_15]
MKVLCFLCLFLPPILVLSSTQKDEFRNVVRNNLKEFRTCIQNTKSAESYKVVIDFTIDDNGAVLSANIDQIKSKINNEELYQCMIDKLKSWKFPKAPKGKTISVKYPFYINNNFNLRSSMEN